MDEDVEDTQWTEAARERYAASAEQLIAQIRRHVELTTGREGRQRELGPYFESTDEVHEAAVAFTDAEFDWCGSTSIRVHTHKDDEDDDNWNDEEDEEGDVLSVLGRWDFRITDPEAFLAAGRRAYAKTWPGDTAEDAEIAVQTPHNVVSELLHGRGLGRVEKAPGVEVRQYWTTTFVHDGTEVDEDDPFGIAVG
ncbi:hypothetical protein LL946_05210 [Knoellia locipacati]|uniref:hypothetical protein n=1 Tax=Knoellia locipacati TaxID=882824 RepID=UPI00385070A0